MAIMSVKDLVHETVGHIRCLKLKVESGWSQELLPSEGNQGNGKQEEVGLAVKRRYAGRLWKGTGSRAKSVRWF